MSHHESDHKSESSSVHEKAAPLDASTAKHDADAQLSRAGVTKIEALTVVFGGWKIWLLYISSESKCCLLVNELHTPLWIGG